MTNPFNKTTLYIVVGVAIASLGVTVALTVLGDDPTSHHSAGSDGYSKSAIGHKAFVQLLEKLDVPVVVSRNNSADKSKSGLLVIAEPKITEGESARLSALVDKAPTILVVLPKWYGYANHDGEWIVTADLLPKDEIDSVLRAIGIDHTGEIVARTYTPVSWGTRQGLPQPKLKAPQTVPLDYLEPAIDDGERALVGHFDHNGKEIWVLTDPDIINNAGLRHPENAQLAVALVDKLRNNGPVVFDETVHGHAQAPSLLRVLFRFPLVLATMQVLICALLAIWAAMVRFGPRRAAPPPLAPGKDFLIANTAALLRYGGHHADALQRYLVANVQNVRHALHAPAQMSPATLTGWLERVRGVRGGTISLPELEEAVASAGKTPQKIVELADQVYRWRMEMIHGSQHRT